MAGLGATPIKKVVKTASLDCAAAERRKADASKMMPDEDNPKKKIRVEASANEFYCLFCDGIFPCRRADRPSTHGAVPFANIAGVSAPLADWVEQRFGHRTKTVCKTCVPKIESFIGSVSARSAGWSAAPLLP